MGKLCSRATSFANHVPLVSLKRVFKREDIYILPQRSHSRARLPLCMLLFSTLVFSLSTISSAQHIGEQAEMNRLEQQADDLAAQDDPDGAALSIGKAAMMADLLRKIAQEPRARNIFEAASHLYRGQEFGLRALALFNQTGGRPPAPAGVCHFLFQGNKKLNQSMKLLTKNSSIAQEHLQMTHTHLVHKNEEWESLLQDLSEDFACPVVSNQ